MGMYHFERRVFPCRFCNTTNWIYGKGLRGWCFFGKWQSCVSRGVFLEVAVMCDKEHRKEQKRTQRRVRYEDKGGETDVEVLNILPCFVQVWIWISGLVGTTPMPL